MSNDLAAEYGNIKAYCRKEAAKSFKHPLAPKDSPKEEAAEGDTGTGDMGDEELDELLREG